MSVLDKPGGHDRAGRSCACSSPHLAVTSTMRLPARLQPDPPRRDMRASAGARLAPRSSIGTLQLSIRCSSIHFLPSRSFPVSDRGVFEGKLAAFDVGGSAVLSWADAGHAARSRTKKRMMV